MADQDHSTNFATWSRGLRRSAAVLMMIAMAAAPLACSKKETAPPVVVNVQAVPAAEEQIAERVPADAVLAPLAQAAIAPKITAPVHRFYVQRGAKVKSGQLLATLENRDLAAAAVDNRGTYDAAEATYKTTTKAQVPEESQKAELDVAQARANLDLNTKIVDSRKQLFAEGAIPGRDLDTAQAALVQAQTTYDGAQKHLESMKTVSHQEALKAAAGQLESAKGKYLGAEASLSYSEIRSPISGVVTERPLFAGETAAAGAPLLTVMDTSALLAKAHLPQSMTQFMKVGSPAEIQVPGIEDAVEGKVSLVSPALDPGSTTVEVWVRVENAKGQLKAGTPVHVTITSRVISKALVIPSSAINAGSSGKKMVMVAGEDNVAHAKEVQTGVEGDGKVQILSGINAGDRVIVTGGYGLDEGTKVNLVSAEDMEKEKGDEPGKPDTEKPSAGKSGTDKSGAAKPGEKD